MTKSGIIIGHLKKGNSGRFTKTMFLFLQADPYASCTATFTGEICNLGDGEGMQVPCKLEFVGANKKYFKKRITEVKSFSCDL